LNILCTSGFVDDVMFSLMGHVARDVGNIDVGALPKQSVNQSINLLANCAKKRIMEDNKSI